MRRLMNTKSVLVLVVGVLGGAVLVHFWGPSSPKASSSGLMGEIPSRVEASGGRGDASGATGGPAFINLETVYNSCKQTKGCDVEIGKLRQDLVTRYDPDRKALEEIQQVGNTKDPNSKEWADLKKEFDAKNQELQRKLEPDFREINSRSLKAHERIYTLIRTCSAKVAKERGFSMVIADIEEPHVVLAGESARAYDEAEQGYVARMKRKTLLYANPAADLTQAVLDAVNAEPGS